MAGPSIRIKTVFKQLTALTEASTLNFTSQLLLQSLGLCNQVLDWNLIHQGCWVGLWLLLHQGWQTKQGKKVKKWKKRWGIKHHKTRAGKDRCIWCCKDTRAVQGTGVIFHQWTADGLHYSFLEGCWSTWVNAAIKETGVNLHIHLA